MTSVSHVEPSLKHILEERANVLARETGCIERQRTFSGADLLQTLVFGWLSHPDASLETLTSLATSRQVSVTDTALHTRLTKSCAHFLHAVFEEMESRVVEASQDAPVELLSRFESVVLEDSSSIALPEELAEQWQGCGGSPGKGQAEGKRLELDALLPQQGGQTHERWVRVGKDHRHLMRLLILRVPQDVAERRRAALEADAKRRAQPVRERAWKLADWTILLTDVPANLLNVQEALVLVRERWQMEMLSKLWKQYGRIDEWRTTNPWRVLCELSAKLIGLLLHHWLILLFARAGMSSAAWSNWHR